MHFEFLRQLILLQIVLFIILGDHLFHHLDVFFSLNSVLQGIVLDQLGELLYHLGIVTPVLLHLLRTFLQLSDLSFDHFYWVKMSENLLNICLTTKVKLYLFLFLLVRNLQIEFLVLCDRCLCCKNLVDRNKKVQHQVFLLFV